MRPRESTTVHRSRCLLRRVGLLAAFAMAMAVPAAALGAAPESGAGGHMPSFLLPNLLALAMSLTILVIACKRFGKE